MRMSRAIALYGLSVVLICCVFSGSTHVGMAADDKEEDKIMDVISELKSQITARFWWVDPDNCRIIPYKDAWLKGRPVFCVIDTCGDSLVFEKDEKNGWIRLSGGGDFSGMNKVLKDYKISKDELNDAASLVKFSRIFLKLYMNPIDVVLKKKYESKADILLRFVGHDKNVDVRALCRDPEIKIDDAFLTIKFNVFRAEGSVERLTLFGKYVDDHITVEQVSTIVLNPIGSFLFDYAG